MSSLILPSASGATMSSREIAVCIFSASQSLYRLLYLAMPADYAGCLGGVQEQR